jgi:peptidoglycan/LPS O-acetylase OafA/YrhL
MPSENIPLTSVRGLVALVLVMATTSWYCIEEPFRRLGSLLARRIERYEPGAKPRPYEITAAPLRVIQLVPAMALVTTFCRRPSPSPD